MRPSKFYLLFCFAFILFFKAYSQDDEVCIVDADIIAIPGSTGTDPTTGYPTFPDGTTVQFCYTVLEYNTAGTQNWIHGIVPVFGSGWDLATLSPVGQPETQFDDDGEWIWTDMVVAGQTGELIADPGWWFDANSGGGNLDGDPSDNWGDGNSGPWEFCFEITTKECPPSFNGANLIIEIKNYADSETGSWNNPGKLEQCIDDPSYYAYYKLDCPTCDESGLTVVNPTCATIDGSSGVIVVTPEGIGPWNYLWFDLNTGDLIQQNDNVSNTVTLSGLPPSEYLIQVEDVGFPGGCSSPIYVDILPPQDIVVDFNIDSASCSDLNDGSILISSIINSGCVDTTLIAEDCCGPLEDEPDGVVNDFDSSCPSTEASVCGCDNITYFNSCQAVNWYGITSYELGPCDSGPNYTVNWTSTNSFEQNPNWAGEINNLFPGEYTVSITNEDNTSPVFTCAFDTTITIYSPEPFVYDFSTVDVDCYEDENNDGVNDIENGFLSIELSGGNADYNIILYDDFANEILNISDAVSPIEINDLPAGDYWFAPLDFLGCGVLEQEVFFTISEPEKITISTTNSNYTGFGISCNGAADGFITISVEGGTGDYSYTWINETTGEDVSDEADANGNLNNLGVGVYSVTVTDENGCDVISEDITLSEPDDLSINNIITQDLSCFGADDGSIELTIDGGVGDYIIEWSNGATDADIFDLEAGIYSITVTDENGCEEEEEVEVNTLNPLLVTETLSAVSCNNGDDGGISLSVEGGAGGYTYDWSTGDINQDIDNLVAGIYSVTISDSDGCNDIYEYEITEPELLFVSVETIDVDCFGDNTGSIITTISGGTMPYTEAWNNNIDPTNLGAGTYNLTVTDGIGCEFTISDIDINEPSESLDVNNVDITLVSCNNSLDGSIEVDVVGGTSPYSISWEGDGFSSNNINIFNLSSGDYTISIVDFNDCEYQQTFNVSAFNPIEISETHSDYNGYGISCNGQNDGFIDVTVIGGDPPYTYQWDGDASFFATSEDLNNLTAGFYSLNMIDANDCQEIIEIQIIEPEELLFTNIESIDIDCFGDDNGLIDVSVNGGVSPYTYEWSNSETSEDISGLEPGLYSLLVEDANGCQIAQSVEIETPSAQLELLADISPIPCNGLTGAIFPSALGGTSPYEFNIDGGGNTDALFAGNYIFYVEDANGCVAENSFTLSEPPELLVEINTINVSCFGFSDGGASAVVSGGTAPYSYSWSSNQDGSVANNLSVGNYSLLVEDQEGCTYTETFSIQGPQNSLMSINFDTETFNCLDPFNVLLDGINVNGGVWSSVGPGSVVFSNQFSLESNVIVSEYGEYEIIFTNSCGSQAISSIQMEALESDLSGPEEVVCLDDFDLLAEVQGDPGVWTGIGPGNIVFGDPTLNNTSVTVDQYGEYLFSYGGCGTSSTIVVEMVAVEPVILGPEEVVCLDDFDLLAEVQGDPGVWTGVGPGNIVFGDPTLNNTSVTVDQYGEYVFTYSGCGTSSDFTLNMNSVKSDISAKPGVVYCDFETKLEASSQSNIGEWSVVESPVNTTVTFADPSLLDTQVSVSNTSGVGECCYGDYLFSFTSCGEEQLLPVSFRKEAPEFGVSTFQDCFLNAAIFIYNPDEDSPGYWEAFGYNSNNVTIENESATGIEFSVTDYGSYQFKYFVCDTFYRHVVGFSCPLSDLPNAFTPNGDSNNDIFLNNDLLIPGIHTQINFTVYNRFGQIIHAKSNFDASNGGLWDGTTNNLENEDVYNGVYYYTLELFNTASGRKESYAGYVHIFRQPSQM